MLLRPRCCCMVLAGFACGPCRIPQANLTLSWTNTIIGPGSTPLIYSAPRNWTSACTHNLLYDLICTVTQVELRVNYFLTGTCPTGTGNYCSNIRSSPFALTQTGLTCGPSFLLTCTCAGACPVLNSNGYTSFTVAA